MTHVRTHRRHFIPFPCPPSDTLLRIPLRSKKQPTVASFTCCNRTTRLQRYGGGPLIYILCATFSRRAASLEGSWYNESCFESVEVLDASKFLKRLQEGCPLDSTPVQGPLVCTECSTPMWSAALQQRHQFLAHIIVVFERHCYPKYTSSQLCSRTAICQNCLLFDLNPVV